MDINMTVSSDKLAELKLRVETLEAQLVRASDRGDKDEFARLESELRDVRLQASIEEGRLQPAYG